MESVITGRHLTPAFRAAPGLLLLGALLGGPANATAAGKTYTVVQCARANRGAQDAGLSDSHSYFAHDACATPGEHAVKIDNTGRAAHGAAGKARWSTRTSSLGIAGIDVTAKLRRARGHASRLWMADSEQRQTGRVASGKTASTTYRRYRWSTRGRGQRQLIASLSCERRAGCPHSDRTHTWVRNLHLRVADYSDPSLTATGSLLTGGWRRGSEDLTTGGSDSGSGLSRIVATVDGTNLLTRSASCAAVPGSPYAKTFDPCPSAVSTSTTVVNTSASPFHDGRDAVSVCATDFAGNRVCQSRTVSVDNTPPTLAFTSTQNPNDPELIRAPVYDATSGVASGHIYYRAVGSTTWQPLATQVKGGSLEARVSSTAVPPGQYEFVAQATDVAGNTAWTTLCQDGQPMVLTFPLKEGVRLTGYLGSGTHRKTIAYRHRSTVGGRLTDRRGHPLGEQEVTVVEHFGSGALIDRRVRTVKTDYGGRWRERIPGGPSRRITATYAGSPRYIGDRARVGMLSVRTKVGLRLSRHHVREGRRVVFRGRVRHYAARIPGGGKLVELQVKAGREWTTVRHAAHTNSRGKYRLRYRFARFYTSNVRYRFRLKVPREAGWPYKAPARSKSRKLVVKAR
jgi:hypothetical protein